MEMPVATADKTFLKFHLRYIEALTLLNEKQCIAVDMLSILYLFVSSTDRSYKCNKNERQ